MVVSSLVLSMQGDFNGVVVEDSEDSSGWTDFVPDGEMLPDFVPEAEILPGFVPEAEILTDVILDSEVGFVPISDNGEGLKSQKRLRSEQEESGSLIVPPMHLTRRGKSSYDDMVSIYLQPVDTTNVGYVPPARAHADPDWKVQERLEKLASMFLPTPKKSS
ncbi:unnamed protein product [Cuscuta epithymum]|uniref:Uncharacterized protein n=1 Tax=Cuscuta epithymum TaxID=186058 RepID=A0AAV0FII2_9ASTE|nr:unnamed protein product [Cuscuta epithymum]